MHATTKKEWLKPGTDVEMRSDFTSILKVGQSCNSLAFTCLCESCTAGRVHVIVDKQTQRFLSSFCIFSETHHRNGDFCSEYKSCQRTLVIFISNSALSKLPHCS